MAIGKKFFLSLLKINPTPTKSAKSELKLVNPEPELVNPNEGTLTSESGSLISGSGSLTSEPSLLSSEPESLSSEPESLSSEPGSLTSEPSPLTSEPGSLISEPGSLISEPSPLTSEPGSLTSEPGSLTSEPSLVDSPEISEGKAMPKLLERAEAQKIRDYTNLVDITLRKAFQRIPRADHANPKGFTDLSRANPEVKAFFQTRTALEEFLTADITTPSEIKEQVAAFTRWINVAKQLLKTYNYEGACLIALQLSSIGLHRLPTIEKRLTTSAQDNLESLYQLISPLGNFKLLRQHVKRHQHTTTFMPTFLMSKDMTFLNEALGEHQNLDLKKITKTHEAYQNLVRKEKMVNALLKLKPCTQDLSQDLRDAFILFGGPNLQEVSTPPKAKPRRKSADAQLQKTKSTEGKENNSAKRPRSKSSDSNREEQANLQKELVLSKSHAQKPHTFFWKQLAFEQESLKEILSTLSPYH